MGKKWSSLTRLSATHVKAFRGMLPTDLRTILDDMTSTSPLLRKWSKDNAMKHSWMNLKRRAPDKCAEIEGDYFRVRCGEALTVLDDMKLAPPVRADIVSRRVREAVDTKEALEIAGALDESIVPLPPTVKDGQGRVLGHPVNGSKNGWGKGSAVNFRQTIGWVAENIYRSDIRPEDAASGTAWALLCWVRNGNETTFWSQLYKCLVPNSSKIASDEERRGNEAGSYNDVRELTLKAMATDGDDVDDIAVSELMDEEEAALVAEGF